MKRFFLSSIAVMFSLWANAQVGIGTVNPRAGLHVADSSVVFHAPGDAIAGLPASPVIGEGRRMMWYADKAAFRVGYVGSASNYWDEIYIGKYSFAGGYNTRATGIYSFAMGNFTLASGESSVALGESATASGPRSLALISSSATGQGAVSVGIGAQATTDNAIAIGPSAISGGLGSIALGPTISNGNYAVSIGLQNQANGQFSMALGKNARSLHQGSVVISDASASFSSDFAYSSAINELTMRFAGGARIFTSMSQTSGVEISSGGGSWSSVSDRRKKEHFQAVDSEQILQKVSKLPLSTWNYKSQPLTTRHMGPMAQDFYAEFGLDGIGNDTTINTVDIDGVNMAAIQALEKRTRTLQEENDSLKAKLEAMDAKFAHLEKLLATPARKEEVAASR